MELELILESHSAIIGEFSAVAKRPPVDFTAWRQVWINSGDFGIGPTTSIEPHQMSKGLD